MTDLDDIFAAVRRPDELGDTDPPAAPITITDASQVGSAVGEAKPRTDQHQADFDATVRSHPDFAPTRRRWYSVCLAAGRDPATAAERADGYAYAYCARRIEREQVYLGQRRVGPPPTAPEVQA